MTQQDVTIKIALVGAPNVGKTSLFNCLTNSQNLIGNWEGVTVNIASGCYEFADNKIIVDDLPGIYSLIVSNNISTEEKLACDYLEQRKEDIILINVINLENITKDLYLTLQLLEQDYKLIIALNNNHAVTNNLANKLNKLFNCPLIYCNAANKFGLDQLNNAIVNYKKNNKHQKVYNYYIPETILNQLSSHSVPMGLLIRYLEGDNIASIELQKYNVNYDALILNNDCLSTKQTDVFFATQRHDFIKKYFIKREYINKKSKFLEIFDSIVLHKYLGLPIFLFIIYSLFFIVSKIIYLTQTYFITVFEGQMVNYITYILKILHTPDWVLEIFNNGLMVGLSTLLNFVPSLFIMHIGLFILENSGYVARAIFLIDKLMGMLGLPGKSLISMVIGFSCNVSAILSTRSIEKSRDRIITILMTPFMSCNARLAVYSIFATAFFSSTHSGNIIFCLYIIGIVSAIITGWILQKTLAGSRSNLIMHLPSYKIPNIFIILRKASNRVKSFLVNSSLAIIGTCVAISCLKPLNLLKYNNLIQYNWFKALMAFFKPMGITVDNWQAVAGLFSGLVAKETIIGSLNAFYHTEGQEICGILYAKFVSPQAAFAYLLFVLLCFPCVSVIASISKELNNKWAAFSVVWTTMIAYIVAVVYYQLATFNQHPKYSIEVLLSIAVVISLMLIIIKFLFKFAKKIQNHNVIPIILN